jgi:ACS family glucarate transporter-like MFS transporter
MLPLLALMAGSFAGGVLSDRILARTKSRDLARRGLSIGAMVACVAFVVVAYHVHDILAAVAVLSAGSFVSALAGPCAYTITIDMGGRHVPTVFGVMNMAGNIGAFLFPIAVPWFRAATSWDSVLLLFGAMYAGAALSWWLLDPRGTVFDQALAGPRRER